MQDVTPPPGEPHGSDRQTVLDGLRGLAIFMVLLVHFWPEYLMPNRPQEWLKKLLHSGWVGVDLFFVLSGFLVTGILLRVQATPGWMRRFYARRALRILPLYLGTLAVVFGLLPLFAPPDPLFTALQQRQGWFWLHLANVAAWGAYFPSLDTPTVSLAHLWSLAVEEHFYLLWPWLVLWLPRRYLPWALLGIIAGVVAFRGVMLATLPPEFLRGMRIQTPARLDGMAMGALLAVLGGHLSPERLRTLAWGGVALCGLVLVGEFVFRQAAGSSSPLIHSLGLTILSLFFASFMALLLTGARRGWVFRAIDHPWWHFFGKYSYGIYVIHGCLIPLLTHWLPSAWFLQHLRWPLLAALVCFSSKTALSVSCALLSWRVLEAPCLRLKDFFAYRTRLRPWPAATSGGK